MAYQEFVVPTHFKTEGTRDTRDNSDSYEKSVAKVATVAGTPNPEKRLLHLADILALPIMPCTTCGKFKWGRRPSCEKYQRLDNPKKGCRCVHYEGRL